MESDEIKIECLGHDSKYVWPDTSATLADDDRRPEDFERKLSRKIDIRLMPITVLTFFVACLDRSNIGNARLAGLEKDLGLSNGQYQIALAVFFIGEVMMKIPSNVILHRFTPSKWISLIIFFWSIVTCFTATIQSFEDLIVTRVFLGITEAGLTPGIMYLLSMWYSPKKLATRFAIYYSGGVSAGAFGGLLAYAITGNLHGVAGLQGWRWLSIIEGFCGFIIALIAYFTLPDFPATSKFLTDQERIFLMSQLGDSPSSTKQCKSTKEFVRDVVIPTFKDWKVYYAMLIKAACGVAINSIILFLPTLVHSMGFDVLHSQLMTAPPYLIAVFFSLSVALHSDKVGERPFHIVGPALVAILGFVLMGISSSPGISYFATFLCSSGVWTIPPVVLTWIADMFTFSYEQRLVAHTVVLTLANLSGTISSNLYPSHDAPSYLTGNIVNAGLLGFLIVLVVTLKNALKS